MGLLVGRWFIIMGVMSILLHQLSYVGHWLEIIPIIFFALNLARSSGPCPAMKLV